MTKLADVNVSMYEVDMEVKEDLAHRRMGTSNSAKLKFMSLQECYNTRGFSTKFNKSKYGRCIICDKARMKQVISHAIVERVSVIGQRWYFDVSGPFKEALLCGSRYLAVFVDENSGLIVDYYTKLKNEVEMLKVIKEFNNEYLVSQG